MNTDNTDELSAEARRIDAALRASAIQWREKVDAPGEVVLISEPKAASRLLQASVVGLTAAAIIALGFVAYRPHQQGKAVSVGAASASPSGAVALPSAVASAAATCLPANTVFTPSFQLLPLPSTAVPVHTADDAIAVFRGTHLYGDAVTSARAWLVQYSDSTSKAQITWIVISPYGTSGGQRTTLIDDSTLAIVSSDYTETGLLQSAEPTKSTDLLPICGH